MKLKQLLVICLLLSSGKSFSQGYCIPVISGHSLYIDNFQFHTLINIYSGFNSAQYVNYSPSQFTTQVNIGQTYPFAVSKNITAGIGGRFAIWIDYNSDSVFANSELAFADTISNHSTSGEISIPAISAFVGLRRLRIVYAWATNPVTPCGNLLNGEVEDYTISIASGAPDTLTYCLPFNQANMDNFMIDDFQLHTLVNNNSDIDSSGYTLYSENLFTTDLSMNIPYPVFISKNSFAGNTGGYAIWIDLNGDGDFSSSEQLYTAGPGIVSTSGFMTIPFDANFVGKRRLRVRSKWTSIPQAPCGLNSAGETEDYIINLNSLTSLDNSSDHLKYLSVFPNPSQGVVRIINTGLIDYLSISDVYGRLIYESQTKQSDLIVQINDPGLYFFTATSGKSTATQKVIIQK
jgi:GEVED domain/Secretion system C-terminal sorting domain